MSVKYHIKVRKDLRIQGYGDTACSLPTIRQAFNAPATRSEFKKRLDRASVRKRIKRKRHPFGCPIFETTSNLHRYKFSGSHRKYLIRHLSHHDHRRHQSRHHQNHHRRRHDHRRHPGHPDHRYADHFRYGHHPLQQQHPDS